MQNVYSTFCPLPVFAQLKKLIHDNDAFRQLVNRNTTPRRVSTTFCRLPLISRHNRCLIIQVKG